MAQLQLHPNVAALAGQNLVNARGPSPKLMCGAGHTLSSFNANWFNTQNNFGPNGDRPLPWGRIPFPCPQDILAENVGWWWVNDKRCSHGTGEWHGRCCVCTMACDWKAGTDSRRAVGMSVAPFVVDKHRTLLPGCDQLLS